MIQSLFLYTYFMNIVKLGKTGLRVNKNGFGALPIQRLKEEDAIYLVRKAYNNGFTFFDTARSYTDSEEKLGKALVGIRDKVYIASKTPAISGKEAREDLEKTLTLLKTDYVDIYQFHNPSFCPLPGDGTGLYEEMEKAKKEGKVGHIGITNHRLDVAREAIESGLYETLQFPFSYISGDKELELVKRCKEKNMGFIAMKGLAGGLLNNSAVSFAFMNQFDSVLPIWGIQRERELDEFISYNANPPTLTDEFRAIIEKDRIELSGEFCRGCGYCMPCPVGIEINQCARMIQMIRRAPASGQLDEKSRAMMLNIKNCLHCGRCMEKCPYSLPIPSLLEKNLNDYLEILNGKDVLTHDARRS